MGWSDAWHLLWPGLDAADSDGLLSTGLATSTDCLCHLYTALLKLLVVSHWSDVAVAAAAAAAVLFFVSAVTKKEQI